MLFKTKRERVLALIFLIAIFLIANILLLPFLNRENQSLKNKLSMLNAKKQESDAWLSQKTLWDSRNAWLKENLNPEDGNAQVNFLNEVLDSAKEKSIEIVQQGLFSRPVSMYNTVGIRLRTRGTVKDIVDWLYQVQSPEKLVIIDPFSCKGTADAGSVECNIDFLKLLVP